MVILNFEADIAFNLDIKYEPIQASVVLKNVELIDKIRIKESYGQIYYEKLYEWVEIFFKGYDGYEVVDPFNGILQIQLKNYENGVRIDIEEMSLPSF